MPLVNGEFTPLELPAKHQHVLTDRSYPWKYRNLRGGRNGAKDWSMIAQCIEDGIRRPIRILFTREVQNTIKESVYQLLCDTIDRLGYGEYFRILNNEISGVQYKTSFIFKGLRNVNKDDIKSFEGLDRVVVCEAQSLSEESFDILDPTIRKPGSEIWFQYNPLFEDDFVHKLCAINPPHNMVGEHVTYLDNPWTSEEILEKANRMKASDIDKYNHIYKGECIKGGVFFKMFGTHMKVSPWKIPAHTLKKRLFVSMDYGFGPKGWSSAGLWYEDDKGRPHRLMTWYRQGMNASQQADDLFQEVNSFYWTHSVMPCKFIYDDQMDVNPNQDEYAKAPIDYFKEKFKDFIPEIKDAHGKCTHKNWIRSNKHRKQGWAIVGDYFSVDVETKAPNMFYWSEFNSTFETNFPKMIMDPNKPEDVFKCSIDHVCDETRYFLVWFSSKTNNIPVASANSESTKITMSTIQRALANHSRSETGF